VDLSPKWRSSREEITGMGVHLGWACTFFMDITHTPVSLSLLGKFVVALSHLPIILSSNIFRDKNLEDY
jgi:hypothetical protein